MLFNLDKPEGFGPHGSLGDGRMVVMGSETVELMRIQYEIYLRAGREFYKGSVQVLEDAALNEAAAFPPETAGIQRRPCPKR